MIKRLKLTTAEIELAITAESVLIEVYKRGQLKGQLNARNY